MHNNISLSCVKRRRVLSPKPLVKNIFEIKNIPYDAVFFHGANSNSLITFLDLNLAGNLHPMGTLLDMGFAPMSGECGNSCHPRSINRKHVSAVVIDGFIDALRFAEFNIRTDFGYLPDPKTISDDDGVFNKVEIEVMISIPQMRKEYLEKASVEVKTHLNHLPFQVVYGIKCKDTLEGQRFNVLGEVAIKGSIKPDEIVALFVPRDKVNYVQTKILGENFNYINVIAIEGIKTK